MEALDRTRGYLARIGIGCTEFTFAEAVGPRQRVMAIRCGGRDQVGVIEWLIGWPDSPTLDWRKGFLAGIYDAEGSYSNGILRICNTDPAVLSGSAPACRNWASLSQWNSRGWSVLSR